MSEQGPEGDMPASQVKVDEFQQHLDDELAFPNLKPGDAWGESIIERRLNELEEILQAWQAEREHGERKGPFDGKKLTGADAFFLAVRSLRGRSDKQTFREQVKRLMFGDWNVNLSDLHLEGAELIGARLEHAPLTDAHLEGALLVGAYLEGAKFDKAHLEDAVLMGAYLEHASFVETHLERAHLDLAHLEHASFYEAHLEHATFVEAHMENARLGAAHLEGADLRLAFLDSGTVLIDAVLGNEASGYVTLADVRWGDVNLAVVGWTQTRCGFLRLHKRIEAIELGDEHEARKARDKDGKPKDKVIRLREYKDAVRANRQLATALRSQGLNEDADRFAYRAQVLQQEALRRQGNLGGYIVSLILGMLSGHGYKLWRILAAYGLVLVTFAVIYLALGVHSHAGEPGIQALWDSFLISLSAIHGRTVFEQLGAWTPAAWAAAVESVFGIIIEGVFVAMLIQRFFSR